MGGQSKKLRGIQKNWWWETTIKSNKDKETKLAWTLDEKREYMLIDSMEGIVNRRRTKGQRRYMGIIKKQKGYHETG